MLFPFSSPFCYKEFRDWRPNRRPTATRMGFLAASGVHL